MKKFLENIIFAAIILVIIQTFLDEAAVILCWNVKARNFLTYSGFGFDIIFTIEFFTRLIIATKKGDAYGYFFYRRGWVDFIASVPLLLLNSGPNAYILMSGAVAGTTLNIGALNILKVVKAIRITRVLRLIRLLKIFGKIKNAESKMAQRHVAVISTTVCASVLIIIIIFTFLGIPGIDSWKDAKVEAYKKQISSFIKLSVKYGNVSVFDQLKTAFENDANVLQFQADSNIYTRYSKKDMQKKYVYDELENFNVGEISVIIHTRDIGRSESKINILFFSIIIFVIVAIMTIYSRHFVQNVSDVIHVINRGMSEPDYFLEAKIKKVYAEDDIYVLASKYNDIWLTFKLKYKDRIYKEKSKEEMSLNDFFGK